MLAQKDESIREASCTVFQLSQEEKIRQQCEAREDYFRRQRSVECYMQEQYNTIQEQYNTIQEQYNTIQELRGANQKQNDTIAALHAEIQRLKENPFGS